MFHISKHILHHLLIHCSRSDGLPSERNISMSWRLEAPEAMLSWAAVGREFSRILLVPVLVSWFCIFSCNFSKSTSLAELP